MKNITIIYPDGSVHQVTAIAIQRYKLNDNFFNLLVYLDKGRTCITPIVEIGGTICKIPYHNINLSDAELLGEELPDKLPDTILSALLLEPGEDMTEAYEQLQVIASQAQEEREWFTKPTGQYKKEKNEPVFEHDLYTTYPHDRYSSGLTLRPQVTYEHLFNVYRYNESSSYAFKKPLLFREIQDAITNIVSTEQREYLLDEIPDHELEIFVKPGTTVADYIKQPDGRVQVALALAIPGIHRYRVTFGKCPNKEVYNAAANPDNVYATIHETQDNRLGTNYAFKAGFLGILPMTIGDNDYDSLYRQENQDGNMRVRR